MKKSRTEESSLAELLLGSLKGLLIAAVIFFVLISVFAVILTNIDLPETAVYAMTFSALGVASFAAAFVNRKKLRTKGIIAGLIAFAEIFLIVIVASLFGTESLFGVSTLIKIGVILLFSLLGGIISANSRKKYK